MCDRPAPVCSPLDASRACRARYDAVARGDFYFSFRLNGWLWKQAHTPRRPWLICPWCGHDLPGVELVYSRIQRPFARG